MFNQAGVACVLDGSPPLELRDANGKLLATGEAWPDAAPVDLTAGQAASTFIGFADWCLPAPKLPFQFDVRIGGERVAVRTTSSHSVIGTPACESHPRSSRPDLFYSGPFALPER